MSYDGKANFAYSTITTAPSPATSGTSLVVQSGHGSRFPTAPFNAVIWPANQLPLSSNAEIVRVTAKSTDTFTITRAQESTSARSIQVGDQIATNITAKWFTDLETNKVEKSGDTMTGQLNVDGALITGGTYATTKRNTLDLSQSTGNSVVRFAFADGGSYNIQLENLIGTNDVVFQAIPNTSAGYVHLEAWTGAGLVLGTGNNSNPVIFRVNRTEVARITSSGLTVNVSGAANAFVVKDGANPVFTVNTDGSGVLVDAPDLLQSSDNSGGDIRISTVNLSNTTNSSVTHLLYVAGASAGDPSIYFSVNGATDWTVGVDNSDSDKFKIGHNAVVGTSTALTIDTSGNVGLSGGLTITRSSGSDIFVEGKRSGETYSRFYTDGFGSLYVGGVGSATAPHKFSKDSGNSAYLNYTNTAGPASIVIIDSTTNGNTTDAESTLTTRINVSGGVEFIDRFANHYSSNGDVGYGTLIQKTGTASYREYLFGYYDAADTDPANQIKRAERFYKIMPQAAAGTTTTRTRGQIYFRPPDGSTNPSAHVHIGQGIGGSTTGSAPLKIDSGTLLTTPEAGAIEFNGTNLFVTNSTPTRKTIAYTDSNITGTSANVTGTVAVANGGTGQTSYTDGQLLIGNSSGNTLAKATLTGTANQITVTNGGGSITLSTPQNIHTAATPTFAGLSTNGAITVTSTSATSLAVGANGSTNPVLKVDSSTASQATGIIILGLAAGNGVSLSTRSSGTDEGLFIDAKGAGAITLGNSSTGNITISRTLNLGTNSISTVGNISVSGTAARDITVARATSGAGQNLTVQAGGAQSGATNTASGSLVLAGGISTGTGTSQILLKTADAGSTGTSDNALTTRATINSTGLEVTGSFRTTPVALTDGATISVNAALGNYFTVTLGGNRTLANPTNLQNGQKLLFRIKQDGTGSRTLTLDTKYRLGADITSTTLSTSANKVDYLGCVYDSTDDKLDVIAFTKGF